MESKGQQMVICVRYSQPVLVYTSDLGNET